MSAAVGRPNRFLCPVCNLRQINTKPTCDVCWDNARARDARILEAHVLATTHDMDLSQDRCRRCGVSQLALVANPRGIVCVPDLEVVTCPPR
jgi:hypothetical protein